MLFLCLYYTFPAAAAGSGAALEERCVTNTHVVQKAPPVNGLSRHKNQSADWYLFHGPIDRGIFMHVLFDKQIAAARFATHYFLFWEDENLWLKRITSGPSGSATR